MKIVVVVQARIGSTRLRGKVLRMLEDRTVLGHVINRCKAIPSVTEVVVATSELGQDDVICEEAVKNGVSYIRGEENDVLGRYYKTATAVQADHIIRVTSDCPLLDPDIVEQLIQYYFQGNFDYARIGLDCFPRGLDAEIFAYGHLKYSHEHASSAFEREHVTQYILRRPGQFLIGVYRNDKIGGVLEASYRLTLDTIEDWNVISTIYRELYQEELFSWKSVRLFLKENPLVAELNKDVEQKHPTT